MSEQSTTPPLPVQEGVAFRHVLNFPGYAVGDDGSVWSCLRQIGIGIGKGTRVEIGESWHRLRPNKHCAHGHRAVTIHGWPYTIHRLVLEAFVGPCPAGMQCRHYPDRDPSNNSLANLQWGTPVENAADRDVHGTTVRGQRVHTAVLTAADVREIRARCAAGESHRSIARGKGVTKSTVTRIHLGRSWRHVS